MMRPIHQVKPPPAWAAATGLGAGPGAAAPAARTSIPGEGQCIVGDICKQGGVQAAMEAGDGQQG